MEHLSEPDCNTTCLAYNTFARRARCILVSYIVIAICAVLSYAAVDAQDQPSQIPPIRAAFDDIVEGYRHNFETLFPLQVTCLLTRTEGEGSIELDRIHLARLKQELDVTTQPKGGGGRPYSNADRMIEMESLEVTTRPEYVEKRLKQEQHLGYLLWTDGDSLHMRWPGRHKFDRSLLGPLNGGPVTPESLAKEYASTAIASWSESNEPRLRLWYGDADRNAILNEGKMDAHQSHLDLPPLGTVREDWASLSVWGALDTFMEYDREKYQLVDEQVVAGRPVLVFEIEPPPPRYSKEALASVAKFKLQVIEPQRRIRAWIDPIHGCMPVRLEAGVIRVSDESETTFEVHDVTEVEEFFQFKDAYYPKKVVQTRYLPRGTTETPGKPIVISALTLTVTEFLPNRPLEDSALRLEFPEGTHCVDRRTNKRVKIRPAKSTQER